MIEQVAALLLLLLLSPWLLLIASYVACTQGRPVLFRQVRAGLGGEPFTLTKFRTMKIEAWAGEPDEHRLTASGLRLRETSLDELPTIWNIVRGDMAFVGPRPLLVEYNERYDATQARRLEVRPGLTGWAQVNGRNALTWPQKLTYDVWYVEHKCLRLDCRILLRTISVLYRRDGIAHTEYATMPTFEATPRVAELNGEKPE
jgi:sugar transferase EpsL